MPPPRIRNAFDDSRSEASSTREKPLGYGPTGTIKGRRNGASTLGGSTLKDVTNATHSTDGQQGTHDEGPPINWSTMDASVLEAYRHAHHLDIPPAFLSPYNQRMLTRPGIGQLSPTMARHKDRRKVGKEQLALAVRKDFNAATVIEGDVVPKFLYTVQNQERNFRMRFEPTLGK
ncbi:hypothetical protein N7G274_000989 [Stereocaulon virgatum]|uniref:Histone deacetylase complex subunit SAP30 Sin3 binding domain-containing protein n=1 Tax=Stereocaulon virgatum TaxID=373712 RepID=A0ABR4AQ59_9LECA